MTHIDPAKLALREIGRPLATRSITPLVQFEHHPHTHPMYLRPKCMLHGTQKGKAVKGSQGIPTQRCIAPILLPARSIDCEFATLASLATCTRALFATGCACIRDEQLGSKQPRRRASVSLESLGPLCTIGKTITLGLAKKTMAGSGSRTRDADLVGVAECFVALCESHLECVTGFLMHLPPLGDSSRMMSITLHQCHAGAAVVIRNKTACFQGRGTRFIFRAIAMGSRPGNSHPGMLVGGGGGDDSEVESVNFPCAIDTFAGKRFLEAGEKMKGPWSPSPMEGGWERGAARGHRA